MHIFGWGRFAALALALAGCGGGSALTPPPATGAAPTFQESQCVAAGWQRLVVPVAGLSRLVLWKAPAGGWARGAIIVMHGGGGTHTNFCAANVSLIEPQVRFTTMAVERGFAVFIADSSDQVTDVAGRLCGKIWDDEVRQRPSVDTAFIDALVMFAIPGVRPSASRPEIFLTGLSSGGYMAVRAATRLGGRIRAFAPVSSGDPYGWTRDCTPRSGDRVNVFGIAFDNETGRPISEPGACQSASESREMPWDEGMGPKPAWRAFHHVGDGIHDVSCVDKLRRRLAARGYPEVAPLRLEGGTRAAEWHYWLDDYSAPLLQFFAAQLR